MKKLGVIIARFQVPELHSGHVHFIVEAAKKSDILVVFLGYKINQPDICNPFSLSVRKAMLLQELKALNLSDKVIIDSIEDHPISSEMWSEELDKKIDIHKENFSKICKENVSVSLYGSRDSFIESYFGKYETYFIKEMVAVSGTNTRGVILNLKEEELTSVHRVGMMYELKNIYPVGMSVVDILVCKEINNEIYFLLGRKKREDSFRLIGGFFDVEKDFTLEEAVLRELNEEAVGIIVGEPKYITSSKIDDWRYRDNQHKIVSSFFVVPYIGGEPIPNDDIKELKWVKIGDIEKTKITKSHEMFIKKAIDVLCSNC